MKAVITTKYGSPDVLEVQEVQKPTPQDNEVLIKIKAAGLTIVASTFRSGKPYFSRLYGGLLKPKHNILGSELAGEVEAVGKNVTLFKEGDEVIALTSGFGAHAEYICLPETGAIVPKPANTSFAEAAAIPGSGTTALPFLRDFGHIKSGQKVLIIGASGSVGSFAVQIARYYGAEVTGVCSTGKMDFVKTLGAAKVIDYTKEDFTKSGATYDVIFDAGGKSSYGACKKALKEDGIYLTTVPSPAVLLQMARFSLFGGQDKARVVFTGLRPDSIKKEDLLFLNELVEQGDLKAVVDSCYPMVEAAEAHRAVESGHKIGKVVIMVEN